MVYWLNRRIGRRGATAPRSPTVLARLASDFLHLDAPTEAGRAVTPTHRDAASERGTPPSVGRVSPSHHTDPTMPHTFRTAALAALALLVPAATLGGCATLGGANYYSLDQEWEMGRQLEGQLRQQLRLTNDRTLNNYVNQIGQAMARQTTLGNRPWRFYVVQDDAINAFNVPGGLVYINTGLIENVGSAGELAGAIAHEVAHGVARHGTQRLSAAQEVNVLASATGVGGGVEGLAAQIAAQGAFASFSRRDEREADQMGVQIMAGAGYDPDGLADLLERLSSQERGGGVAFFRSHPLSSERMETVRGLARRYDGRNLRMNDGQFASARRRAAQL